MTKVQPVTWYRTLSAIGCPMYAHPRKEITIMRYGKKEWGVIRDAQIVTICKTLREAKFAAQSASRI